VQDSQEKAKTSILAARVRVAQAEAALDLEKAGVQEIQREIEGVKVDLDKCRIRAPFAGRFEEHSVEAGEVVSPGLTLGRVYDLRYLRARVDVPDRYAPLVDPNSPLVGTYVTAAMPGARQSLAATVRIPGLPKLMGGTHSGVAMDAEIARVAQAADPRSNTFQVELRFENPGEALKEGILAEAQIDFLTYPEALVIPVKAVQVSDVGPRVFVVEQDSGQSVARVRDIEPISIREDRILVRGGLSPHEQLIVSGGKGLVDGEPVNVVIVDGELTTGDDRAAVAAAGESGEAAGFIKVPAGVAAGQQPGAAE
jgi:RND family efflux transporter MFP subunit